MALARSRLLRELREANKSEDPIIRLKLCNNNILNWTAYIRGPDNSPYEDGIFKLNITCPPDYPMNPPSVTFETKIFHPNISFKTGEVCMDVLKSNWSPAWTLAYLCRGIVYILGDPNAESPLNCDAGNLLRSGDILGYNSVARMYTIDEALNDNLIYVRNISPDVTEQTIRDCFGACDEIVSIEFKKFNQSDRRYCKIEFKTSTGITKASHMNGSLLLGCPLEITVTDPTSLMQDKQDGVAAGQNGVLAQQQQVDAEEMHKSRCVKISNLPHKYDRIDVYTLLGSIGTIVSCRLETSQGTRSATVEFKSCFEANEALKMTGVSVGTNVLKVIKVVAPRQSNVQLPAAAATASISTSASSRNDLDLPTEPARSAVFNEKLAKVLEMRERIHRKLANRTEASAPSVAKPRAADENNNNGWWSRRKSESQQRQGRSRRRSKSTSLSSSSKRVLRNDEIAKSTRDKQEGGRDDDTNNTKSSSPGRSREYSRGKSQRSLSTASDASRGKSRRHRHRHEKHHRRHRSSHSRSHRHHHHRRHRHGHRRDSSSPSRSRSRSRSFTSRHSKSSRR